MKAADVKTELRKYASKEKAKFLSRYFKTGKGEYAEGDVFLGLTVPQSRKIAQKYKDLSLKEVGQLLKSKAHEERQIALMILSLQSKKTNLAELEELHKFYLDNLKYVNNWDLVDGSAENLVGKILRENPGHIVTFKGQSLQGTKLLVYLAKSDNVWERRIAIVSTFEFIAEPKKTASMSSTDELDSGMSSSFRGNPARESGEDVIKNNKFEETLKIAKLLLEDRHDLIHKAIGWMLREVGKRDQKTLEKFLKDNYSKLPRTTLRYAIEKFPRDLRLQYLKNPDVLSPRF